MSSPDDGGTYGIGAAINVTVRFAEDVAVDTAGGTPYLELETGETDRRAGYVSGSPGRDLLFRYTVAENDTAADLDYSGASALALNGGSIADDPAGNAATAASLSLSGLSGQDTLAGSEDLAVDGVRPEVASVTSPTAPGTYYSHPTKRVHYSSPAGLTTFTLQVKIEYFDRGHGIAYQGWRANPAGHNRPLYARVPAEGRSPRGDGL